MYLRLFMLRTVSLLKCISTSSMNDDYEKRVLNVIDGMGC